MKPKGALAAAAVGISSIIQVNVCRSVPTCHPYLSFVLAVKLYLCTRPKVAYVVIDL